MVLQPGETCAAAWADEEKLLAMEKRGELPPAEDLRGLLERIALNRSLGE